MCCDDIRHAETTEELRACFTVMQQLRPHLPDENDFIKKVTRMRSENYALLVLWQEGIPVALAGYRSQENLIYGRFLYVDDLIVTESCRSAGYGALLLQKAEKIAGEKGCDRLVLDTGLDLALAQRFYFRQGMLTGAIGFSKILKVHEE